MEALHGVYGADLERVLGRSRIVLTVHYHPTRVFDAARVLPLLANGRFVVAEDSVPCQYGEALGSGLAVHAYDDLVEACLHYLRHPEEREAVAARGWRTVRRFRQARHLEPWVCRT